MRIVPKIAALLLMLVIAPCASAQIVIKPGLPNPGKFTSKLTLDIAQTLNLAGQELTTGQKRELITNNQVSQPAADGSITVVETFQSLKDTTTLPGGATLKFDSAEEVRRWLSVLSKLENREMPPEDEKQPSDKERKTIIAGITRQLHLSGNPVEQLRSAPKYGNYVNHAELFSGEHKGPAFSRPRIWRISPYIDGQSSPFSLSQDEGFKDYAHMWSMDKPTIELLLVKARSVVEKQIGPSEAMLEAQDGIWKQQILTKRRNLEKELQDLAVSLEKNPANEGLKKRVLFACFFNQLFILLLQTLHH